MTDGTTSAHSIERPLLIGVLALFGALTLVAVVTDGLPGTLDAITYNWASLQIYFDLVIAVGVISVWIYRDAHSRGRNPWPWILAGFAIGMFSPLVYLLLRTGDR